MASGWHPTHRWARAHDAITQRVDAAFAAGVFVDHPTAAQTITFAASGDIASVVGTYKVTINGTTVDIGKFVHVLRHTPHGWRIANDIFNSDLPVPATK